jgi:hypothetical protein
MFILGIVAWAFIALLILAVFVIVSVEKEEPWGAFIAILLAGVVAHFSGTVNMVEALHNWQQLVGLIGAYIAVGVGWCMIKWVFYTNEWARNQRENIKHNRKVFLKTLNLSGDSIPDAHKDAWVRWNKSYGYARKNWVQPYSELNDVSPERVQSSDAIAVTNNWSKFSIWGLYWPFSMLWTLIEDITGINQQNKMGV